MDVSNHFWISPQDTSTPERIVLQSMDDVGCINKEGKVKEGIEKVILNTSAQ